ncbi:MAG TPA: protein-L-isoaspartate(D-aspartate) O-methyltransferase [Thermoanaerobaculia bacterium]|nr:protein-L-isoaspartate(D-aspartate) O-methyltransferase [Thermoanaerobaculia bacterium]HUM29858.1 protein-L-isoaspartate(D-aspartate) O-methyltransferase [Thermoanaerobaculia bacterium]HXK68133.1 protein-L-isoaspartate(D-aspartate) O-methyltransferase [Thermoanaerobaculia bacterium]
MRFLCLLLLMMACSPASSNHERKMIDTSIQQRTEMVEEQIIRRGVKDPDVLRAMKVVPRHRFVPENFRAEAYADYPLPIGEGQTISQPYIVARMTELLHVNKGDRVLEVGTGSGYQAAILAEMGVEVYTIEILPSLARHAKEILASLNYPNVTVLVGDGYKGYPEAAPYDGIIVTAASPKIPEPLLQQLKVGKRMVIPVGRYVQELKVVTKEEGDAMVQDVIPVRFVPMIGEVERTEE